MIVKEEDVEKALKRLRVTTEETAVARGQLVLMEGMTKTVLAREIQKQPAGTSAAAAKELALASEAYEEQIKAESLAAENYERLKLERETCFAWIEVFRTLEASNRRNDKAHQ